MNQNNFDSKVLEHMKNILVECLYYANNETNNITTIYIYISFEWVIYFNVFFLLSNNQLYRKHKINNFITNANTSSENQSMLNKYCNLELNEIKQLFIEDDREVPTQIKIKYSTNGKFETKFSYEKHHNTELFIGDDEVANEWFEEIQKMAY
ncbi:hypothetical protein FACS189413_05930 [Bacteroidia bacterium]|nr:hypothetical protein FACS189413_05930 [Bacteroidia bacterium]